METIKNIINENDFTELDNIYDTNERWISFKEKIISAVNSIAPLKQVEFKIKDENSPWFDDELKKIFYKIDFNYTFLGSS